MKTSIQLLLLLLLAWASPLQASEKGLSSVPPSARKWAYFEPYLRGSYSRFAMHGGLGITGFAAGEVNSFTTGFRVGPHFSLGGSFRLTNYISFRAEVAYLEAGARGRYYPAGSTTEGESYLANRFTARGVESHIGIVHDIFSKKEVEFNALRWNPYVFAGVGLIGYSLQDKETKYYYAAQRNAFGFYYTDASITFPVGVGVNYYLKDYISLGFELGYRFANTFTLEDYIIPSHTLKGNVTLFDDYVTCGIKLQFQFLPRNYRYKNYLRTGH